MIEQPRGPRWIWLLVLVAVAVGIAGGLWLYGAVTAA
jgi:hypothetical protein